MKGIVKSEMLKKTIRTGAVVLFAAYLSIGCGTSAKKPETNDSVKIEEEVKQEEDFLSSMDGVYVTEHCIYSTLGDKELVQTDRQGKELHRYSLDKNAQIEGISEEFVCYSVTEKECEYDYLYVAPIVKSEKGEKVLLEKSRKIAETEEVFAVYVWKSGVYYISDHFYYYDAEKKETECVLRCGDDEQIQFCEEYDIIEEGTVYLTKSEGTVERDIFGFDMQRRELNFFGKVEGDSMEIIAVKDHLLFCCVGDEYFSAKYFVYDTLKREKRAELDRKQIDAALKQLGIENDFFRITAGKSRGEQIDLVVEADAPEKITATDGPQKGQELKMCHPKQILLHCPWQNPAAFTIDKKLFEWMDQHVNYTDVYVRLPLTGSAASHYQTLPNIKAWNFCGENLILVCTELERKVAKKEDLDINNIIGVKKFTLKVFQPDGKIRDLPETDWLLQFMQTEQMISV